MNFDRVWENVANDFGYNPDVARNVNADVRYLLWNLDVIEGATDLLKELGVDGEVSAAATVIPRACGRVGTRGIRRPAGAETADSSGPVQSESLGMTAP